MEHITIEKYLQSNPQDSKILENAHYASGNTLDSFDAENPFHCIYTNNHSYLIYERKYEHKDLYFVWAIYTKEKDRGQGYAKALLKSINENMLLMFDAFSDELKTVMSQIGASEVFYFNGSADRQQYIYDTSGQYDNIPTSI